MSELTIYNTNGTIVYPREGESNGAVAALVDELASVPPWPIALFDAEHDRLLQRFIAIQHRDDSSTRPNNFYVVLEPSGIADGGLSIYADELSSLFDGEFNRPTSLDRPDRDPAVVERTWRETKPDSLVPRRAATQLLDRDERQVWRVPDLESGYALAAEYATLTESGSIVLIEDDADDWTEDVVIEVGNVDAVEPVRNTRERLVEEMTDSYEPVLEDLLEQLSEGVREAVIPEDGKQQLDTLLAWIVVTGTIHRNLAGEEPVLPDVVDGDRTALTGEYAALANEYQQFEGVSSGVMKRLLSAALEGIDADGISAPTLPPEKESENADLVNFEPYEASLRDRYRRYHLTAVKQYEQRVAGTTGEEWFAAVENVRRLRDRWVDDLDDPGVQVATWPVIRWLTRAQPTAKASPVAERLDQRIGELEETMMDDRLDVFDEQVEAYVDDCVEQFDFDPKAIRRRYLATSETFGNGDLLRVVFASYRWVFAVLVFFIVAAAGAGAAYGLVL